MLLSLIPFFSALIKIVNRCQNAFQTDQREIAIKYLNTDSICIIPFIQGSRLTIWNPLSKNSNSVPLTFFSIKISLFLPERAFMICLSVVGRKGELLKQNTLCM